AYVARAETDLRIRRLCELGDHASSRRDGHGGADASTRRDLSAAATPTGSARGPPAVGRAPAHLATVRQALARLHGVRLARRNRCRVRAQGGEPVNAPDVRGSRVEAGLAHPLDFDSPRLSVQKPAVRYDVQGERSDADRVASAVSAFTSDFGRDVATWLESCIHCGNCAEACPFYLATGEAKYTPTWKLEPFARAYRREAGPFAWLYRSLGMRSKVTVEELEAWQELVYDTCTLCGRCTLACPMGIDIASLVGLARHGMAQAGLVPHELWAVSERAAREGSPLGATPAVLQERLEWLADEHEVAFHIDLPRADVLVTFSSIEIMKYPLSLVATARVMEHAGCSWTISSAGYEATNFGMLAGSADWQRRMTMKIIDAAIACEAKIVVLPECGHAYSALRWQGAGMLGRPLPFRVLHISEFLAENLASGRIRVRRASGSVAFHDPCQISRRGGATQAPRDV